MEVLAPPCRFVISIRQRLESGQSLRRATLEDLGDGLLDEFQVKVQQMLQVFERGGEREAALVVMSTPIRRAIGEILWRGWGGEPILGQLCEIQDELIELSKDAIERHLQRLPLLMLVPLLGLIFPGVMLVILGPILGELLEKLH